MEDLKDLQKVLMWHLKDGGIGAAAGRGRGRAAHYLRTKRAHAHYAIRHHTWTHVSFIP
jgi:hypothetical protein